MNKTCARCLRTVYPVEELKCLDKVRIKHFLFLINLNRASVHSESGRQYNLLNGHSLARLVFRAVIIRHH